MAHHHRFGSYEDMFQPMPEVGQLFTRRGKSRRVREIYKDEKGQTWVRYLKAGGVPDWCTLDEWYRWRRKAVLIP